MAGKKLRGPGIAIGILLLCLVGGVILDSRTRIKSAFNTMINTSRLSNLPKYNYKVSESSLDVIPPDNQPMKQRQVQRRHEVQEYCQAHQSATLRQSGDPDFLKKVFAHMLVDVRHRAIYCFIAKTGSAEWINRMTSISGRTNVTAKGFPHSPSRLAAYGLKNLSEFPSTKREYFIKNYFKFISVRHPFLRIVSLYLRHYQRAHPVSYPFYKMMRIRMKKPVPFQKLIDFITDNDRGDNEDVHYLDYFKACAPCHMKYDVIIKHETYGEDSNYVLDRLKERQVRVPPWTVGTASSKARQLWNSLSPSSQKLFEEIYRPSAEAFGYNITRF